MFMMIISPVGYNFQMKSFAVEVGKNSGRKCAKSDGGRSGRNFRALERGKR